MRFTLVGLLAATVATASCGGNPGSAPVDVDAEAKEIMRLESEWSAMFGAKDLDGITALLAQNSALIMPGSPPVVGVEHVRQATRTMLESDDLVSWKSDFAAVAPSGDMAYDYGTATTTFADGSVVEGHYLVVWVKENGSWKVAADMFN
ncbi:MAG: nuclear transport factor 2 family protein [Pseudomonadales bacterium]